jgi:hypothetical protein
MIRDWKRGAVVVGIDGETADDAVDWAAAKAATRGCPLRVVHAFHPLLLVDPSSVVRVTGGPFTIPPRAGRVSEAL